MTQRHSNGLSGWGRLFYPGQEQQGEDLEALTRAAGLTRGLARSYGDSSLPAEGGLVIGSRQADRVLSWDRETGILRAEAGLSLREMNRVFLPQGWFTPVSPGTQEVTLGGMVAADVHGKNHHVAGTFGRHVRGLKIRTGADRIVECDRSEEPELFLASLGGMGMTGHILEVTVQLEAVPSGWIERESVRTRDLEDSVATLMELGERWPYTVAWIDCLVGGGGLGRGIVEGGSWCSAESAPSDVPGQRTVRTIPIEAPNLLLNRLSLGFYNRFRYRRHWTRKRQEIVHYEDFFYPLDGIGQWNRLYGRRGMTQYQCVLPRRGSETVVRRFLEHLKKVGGRPFLVVLKDFGAEGDGYLSFPRPGFTLAVDFAVDNRTEQLVASLDDFVLEAEGRIYLAKEMFSAGERYRAMEGERLDRLLAVKHQWDPEGRICSRQWARLVLDRIEDSPPTGPLID